MTDKFKLPSRILAYCRGVWSDEKHGYDVSAETDPKVVTCCLDNCRDHVDYCYRQCRGVSDESRPRCEEQCGELIGDCEDVCLEYPVETNPWFADCVTEKGCGQLPRMDVGCLHSKGEDVLGCCREKCLLERGTNCDKVCRDTLDSVFKNDTMRLREIKTGQDLSLSQERFPSVLIRFILVSVLITIFFLWVVWKRH